MHSGKEYDATLVAADNQSDIAVIKVNAKDLDPVTLNEEMKYWI